MIRYTDFREELYCFPIVSLSFLVHIPQGVAVSVRMEMGFGEQNALLPGIPLFPGIYRFKDTFSSESLRLNCGHSS